MSRDVPPFFTLTGMNLIGSVNLVGMRRNGMSSEEIADVRWAYRILSRNRSGPAAARQALEERADRPLIAEYIRFLAGSKTGILSDRTDPRRSGEIADVSTVEGVRRDEPASSSHPRSHEVG